MTNEIVDRLGSVERRICARVIAEHDKRVDEYIELEKMLPRGLERAAIRCAITALRDSGQGRVADMLSAYMDRLTQFDR